MQSIWIVQYTGYALRARRDHAPVYVGGMDGGFRDGFWVHVAINPDQILMFRHQSRWVSHGPAVFTAPNLKQMLWFRQDLRVVCSILAGSVKSAASLHD
jgi:hypothetical protein